MDKRFLALFLAIVTTLSLLSGCTKKYKIITDVNAMEEIYINEFLNDIDNKVDGIYLMSSKICPSCNKAFDIINSAAVNTDNTIKYINLVNDGGRISEEDADKIIEILGDNLRTDPETGEKVIYTPHLFIIRNGEVVSNFIGLGSDFEDNDKGKEKLHIEYIEFLDNK